MREIKFRAYSPSEDKMYYFDLSTYMKVNEAEQEDLCSSEAAMNGLMQFTGLKDKNGKEIYEGDILKESEHGIFEVVWDLKWAKFKLDHTRVGSTIQYPEWNRGIRMEIIGNIYENPDLLTPSK